MLNRTATAVVRMQSAQSYSRKLFALAVQSGHGVVYGPSSHEPVAMNVGSRVRPEVVPVRVHEPLSVLDALEVGRPMHSWSLDAALRYIARQPCGVVVLLNCGESAPQLLAQFEGTARASHGPERGTMDLRSYGVGAQILRDCGVHRMTLLGNPRRLPSMTGYGLEVEGHLAQE